MGSSIEIFNVNWPGLGVLGARNVVDHAYDAVSNMVGRSKKKSLRISEAKITTKAVSTA
jgi:hypothetical protein